MRLTPARLFCPVIALLAAASVTRAEDIDLSSLFQRVEQMSAGVLIGRETAVQARAVADQQRVALLPNVALRAQQQRAQTVAVSAANAASTNAPAGRFDATLNGSVNLLNLQQLATYRAAKRGADAADADAASTLQSALAAAGNFYFTQLRNQARDAVLAANVTRAEELLKITQNVYSVGAGTITKIDVTRAEALLAQARLAQLQNQTVTKQGLQQLQLILDVDAMTPLTVRPATLLPATTGSSATQLIVRAQAMESFFKRRADWQRASLAVEQAILDEKAALYQRAPALALTGSVGQAGAYYDTGKRDAWAAGLALSVPVFDGLKANADRRVTLSRRRVQEIRLRTLENQIKAEIDAAETDVNSRFQQIEVANQNLKLAEEQMRLARVRLQEGAADNREIIEAQNQLAIASDSAVEARYRYNLSRVELSRAKGEVRELLSEKRE